MARKSKEAMLLAVLDEARMMTLPLAVQMLWLKIARRMMGDGISVFRFGSYVLGLNGLARLLSLPETESETELETKITELCERGLLAREADGAIGCPMLAQALTRSEINRINGSKGGRPRKDGVPPGQRSMPLVGVVGGTDMETERTKPETEARNIESTTTVTSKKVVEESVFEEVGKAVLDVIGIDPARSFMNYGLVRQWLADGATKELILDVVGKIVERPGVRERVKSLNFFNGAIAEAIAKMPPKKALWEKRWEEDYRLWELTGKGQAPRAADYRDRYAA